MDVNRVEGPLVVLQADRGGRHRLVVLGADDDDDQVLFLRETAAVSEALSCFIKLHSRTKNLNLKMGKLPSWEEYLI